MLGGYEKIRAVSPVIIRFERSANGIIPDA
jgi:hypothetical protein